MIEPPIDDMRLACPLLECLEASLDFRNHAASNDTLTDILPSFRQMQRRNKR